MHEIGLAESALQLALTEARRAGASRVLRLVLRVGTLSGVEPDALQFALQSLLPGTPAEDALVQIDSVAAMAFCAGCRKEFPVDAEMFFVCAACGRPSENLTQGRELELSRVELSFPHAAAELQP